MFVRPSKQDAKGAATERCDLRAPIACPGESRANAEHADAIPDPLHAPRAWPSSSTCSGSGLQRRHHRAVGCRTIRGTAHVRLYLYPYMHPWPNRVPRRYPMRSAPPAAPQGTLTPAFVPGSADRPADWPACRASTPWCHRAASRYAPASARPAAGVAPDAN
jgi:hypothetical protein